MKRFKKIAVVSLVSASLLTSSLVFAQGWNNRGPRGMGYSQQQQTYYAGPGRVLRTEMNEARIKVLAELSGQSTEDIRTKLNSKPMWAVLDEYKITVTDFQSAMHEKADDVVRKAIEDGKLTQEQGDLMLKQMEEGPRTAMGPRFGNRRGMGKRGGMGYRNMDGAWQGQGFRYKRGFDTGNQK